MKWLLTAALFLAACEPEEIENVDAAGETCAVDGSSLLCDEAPCGNSPQCASGYCFEPFYQSECRGPGYCQHGICKVRP